MSERAARAAALCFHAGFDKIERVVTQIDTKPRPVLTAAEAACRARRAEARRQRRAEEQAVLDRLDLEWDELRNSYAGRPSAVSLRPTERPAGLWPVWKHRDGSWRCGDEVFSSRQGAESAKQRHSKAAATAGLRLALLGVRLSDDGELLFD